MDLFFGLFTFMFDLVFLHVFLCCVRVHVSCSISFVTFINRNWGLLIPMARPHAHRKHWIYQNIKTRSKQKHVRRPNGSICSSHSLQSRPLPTTGHTLLCQAGGQKLCQYQETCRARVHETTEQQSWKSRAANGREPRDSNWISVWCKQRWEPSLAANKAAAMSAVMAWLIELRQTFTTMTTNME